MQALGLPIIWFTLYLTDFYLAIFALTVTSLCWMERKAHPIASARRGA